MRASLPSRKSLTLVLISTFGSYSINFYSILAIFGGNMHFQNSRHPKQSNSEMFFDASKLNMYKNMGFGEKSHFSVILAHILVFFAKPNRTNRLIFLYVLRNIYSDNIYFLKINLSIRVHKNPLKWKFWGSGVTKQWFWEEGGGMGPKFHFHWIAQHVA